MNEHLRASGERSVVVGRDVINSIINTGDHNRFFIGDYEHLRDAYIEPWSVFERVNLDHFVGREWLLEEIDAFLRDADRGYFILEANAGLGKTTFLAWLVRSRGYIHHFSELAPGMRGIGGGLKNLSAQLVLAYNLNTQRFGGYEAEGLLPGAAARPDYLSRLLNEASDKRRQGEKVVIVVDALDEAGTPLGENVLGLPRVLPEGVFLIASQRPVPVTLIVDNVTTPRRVFRLSAGSEQNQIDMRLFLEKAVSWPGIQNALEDSGYNQDQFVSTLLEKCRGVWIYLHFIVNEIERGERFPLELEGLPNGMTQYYARYWQNLRDTDEEKWYEVYLPLLVTLTVAQEPITVERLLEWAEVRIHKPQLLRLLRETWRPYLAIEERDGDDYYRFYHATLREFFEGRVSREQLTSSEMSLMDELVEATRNGHRHLVERYLASWGGLDDGLPRLVEQEAREMDDSYGLRHLVHHLQSASRVNDIHRLLELENEDHRNVWYEAKRASGELASYIADVSSAWQLAAEAYDLPDRERSSQSLSLQHRYALITTSVNSLAGNIPPALLIILVKKGLWTTSQGLSYARQVPDPEQRSEALAGLSDLLSGPEKEKVLREALAAASSIEDVFWRAGSLAVLVPKLPKSLLAQALTVTQAIEDVYSAEKNEPRIDEHSQETLSEEGLRQEIEGLNSIESEADKVYLLTRIVSRLPKTLLDEALEIARGIQSGYQRTRALALLAPRLVELDHTQEAKAVAEEIEIAYQRRGKVALERLISLPEGQLRENEIQEKLQTAREIEDLHWRAQALTELIPHLPASLQVEILQEALNSAMAIGDGHYQAIVLMGLAEYLARRNSNEMAISLVLAIQNEDWRGQALLKIAPHLPKSSFEEVLEAVVSIKDEQQRADVLAKLGAYIPEELLSEAMQAVYAVDDGYLQANLLVEFIQQLSGSLKDDTIDHALSIARSIGDDFRRVEILGRISSHLDEPMKNEILEEAMEATYEFQEAYLRTRALIKLVPYLPERAIRELLRLSQSIEDVDNRSHLLGQLALSFVRLGKAEEALIVARTIPDEYWRSETFNQLTLNLAETDNLREALVAIREIKYEHWQAKLLIHLAPKLSEQTLKEGLRVAQDIGAKRWQAVALVNLAACLTGTAGEASLHQALNIVKLLNEDEKTEALIDMAPYLTLPLLEEVLEMVRGYASEENRLRIVTSIIPNLAREGDSSRALSLARSLADNRWRAAALADTLSYLPDAMHSEVLLEVMATLVEVVKTDHRVEVMIRILPYLEKHTAAAVYEPWRGLLYSLANRERKDLLSAVSRLLPMPLLSGTDDSALKMAEAIQDVGRWWP